jgi:hypothetical protein
MIITFFPPFFFQFFDIEKLAIFFQKIRKFCQIYIRIFSFKKSQFFFVPKKNNKSSQKWNTGYDMQI